MAFSVLMSVYKNEKPAYLKECLESIRIQTLLPDEVLLMLDGPIPTPLEEVIEHYKGIMPYLRTHQISENVQLGRALQMGIELCTNELVARMDTDDKACSDRFLIQYNYMITHPNIDVTGGWIEEFHDNGNETKVKKMPEQTDDILSYAKYRNPLNHMTVMMRRESVLAAGNYKHFPLLEDYNLWLRMISRGCKFYNIQKVLVLVRTNDSMYERRGGMEYCKNYLILRKIQHELGITNIFEYIKGIIMSIAITIQPPKLRKIVYKKILRK